VIIAAVRAGTYFIISVDDFKVVGEITRLYKPAPTGRGGLWSDGYLLRWVNDGEEEYFRTLEDIHLHYPFENYPGYNSILTGQKTQNSSRQIRNFSRIVRTQ
jgi:hypothetical protein